MCLSTNEKIVSCCSQIRNQAIGARQSINRIGQSDYRLKPEKKGKANKTAGKHKLNQGKLPDSMLDSFQSRQRIIANVVRKSVKKKWQMNKGKAPKGDSSRGSCPHRSMPPIDRGTRDQPSRHPCNFLACLGWLLRLPS